jgi:hypothetical protein
MNAASLRDRVGALIALAGGVLVTVGTLLPWMSLFAGLYRYSGIHGLYGRLTFVGGVLAALGAATMLARSDWFIRPLVGGIGVALVLFASWILIGLRETTRHLAEHPMLVARPGAGLFVVLAGAVMVASLALPKTQWRIVK